MKKVLIITYYWPPAGGIFVFRNLKLVKYIRDFGWEPIVYTAKNADYPIVDEDNYNDIPKNITIIKKEIVEPFKVFKFLFKKYKKEPLSSIVQVRSKGKNVFEELAIWIRGNFFIPDARSLWIRPSVKYLNRFVKKNKVDAIFAAGPPHTNTRIATLVSKKNNIPFIADFEDPWTQADYYKLMKITPIAHKIHRKMENEIFNTASLITIVSDSWKKDLEKIGAKNVNVVHLGFDEEDFNGIDQNLDNTFSLLHTGLLGHDRNPEVLFQACREICDENENFKNDLKIKIAGQIDYKVIKSILDRDLSDNLENVGYVSRKKALQLTLNAQLLLLPLNISHNISGRIPGKFFEYIRSGRPIINFGPLDSDVAKIIKELNCGITVEYNDITGIKNYLISKHNQYKANIIENLITDISNFSVRNKVMTFSKHLNDISN